MTELDELRRELEEIRRLQRPEPPPVPYADEDYQRHGRPMTPGEYAREEMIGRLDPAGIREWLGQGDPASFRDVGLAPPLSDETAYELDRREYAEEYVRTQYPKHLARMGRFREAGLAQPSWSPGEARWPDIARQEGLAQPSHPYYSPTMPPWPRDPRDDWTEEDWENFHAGELERVEEQAASREPWEAVRRAREAAEGRLRSIPASLLYRMYGYDPFGPAHPMGTRLGGEPLGRIVSPLASGSLYDLLRKERGYRTRQVGEEEARYYSRSGESMLLKDMRIPDVMMRLGEEELAQGYPWTEYGRSLTDTVPWRAPTPEEHIGFYRPGEGEYGEVVSEPTGIIPAHEFAHAADWEQDLTPSGKIIEFRDDILDWLGEKAYDEMSQSEKRALLAILNDNVTEAYAIIGQSPQFIPPELEHWYPQYDLTQRQAMGRPQRLDYQGPPERPTIPPPPLWHR